jgi:hypothetical protein
MLDLDFTADVWTWRGQAPYYFVRVPAELGEVVKLVSGAVTYGWGMIPVTATIGGTTWKTAMWPKDGGYVLPLKDVIRRAERIAEGDEIAVRLSIEPA